MVLLHVQCRTRILLGGHQGAVIFLYFLVGPIFEGGRESQDDTAKYVECYLYPFLRLLSFFKNNQKALNRSLKFKSRKNKETKCIEKSYSQFFFARGWGNFQEKIKFGITFLNALYLTFCPIKSFFKLKNIKKRIQFF